MKIDNNKLIVNNIKSALAVDIKGNTTLYTNDKSFKIPSLDSSNIFEVAKRCKGFLLRDSAEHFEIYTDPFLSIPVYFSILNGCLDIFSDFLHLKDPLHLTIDPVGLWESILLGNCFWTRTLYKNIFQIPAASILRFNKNTFSWTISRYFDFVVKKNTGIKDEASAVSALDQELNKLFSRYAEFNTDLTIGLSGGVDSRVTAAYVSRYFKKSSVNFFTFGSDSRQLEYKYATEVALKLGLAPPVFYKLDNDYYRRSLREVPVITGGHINQLHGHIYDCLQMQKKSLTNEDVLHVSVYYTDAIFGFACNGIRTSIQNGFNEFRQKIFLYTDLIGQDNVQGILEDMDNAFLNLAVEADKHDMFSCFAELKYVVERNPKFHMQLAHAQSKARFTVTPYADFNLFEICFSIPIKYRANKKILDILINNQFSELSKLDNISSRFFRWDGVNYGVANFLNKLNYLYFRLINFVNALSRKVGFGEILFNKYHTEEPQVFMEDFKYEFNSVITYLQANSIINEKQAKFLTVKPFRSTDTHQRYQLISLFNIISQI